MVSLIKNILNEVIRKDDKLILDYLGQTDARLSDNETGSTIYVEEKHWISSYLKVRYQGDTRANDTLIEISISKNIESANEFLEFLNFAREVCKRCIGGVLKN